MTLFKKSTALLEELEKDLHAQQNAPATSAIEHLAQLKSTVGAKLSELQPAAEKLKRGAEETDPDKKTYGPGMVTKILEFHQKYVPIAATAEELLASVSAAAQVEEEAAAKKAAEEAAAKQAVEEAAAKQAAEEAAAKKAAEEAAAKKAAEEAAARKVAEDQAAAKKAAEEAAAKKAAEEAAAKKAAEEAAAKQAAEEASAKKAAEVAAAKKAAEEAAAKKAAEDAAAQQAAAATASPGAGASGSAPPPSQEELLKSLVQGLAGAVPGGAPAGGAAPAAAAGGAPARGTVHHVLGGANELRMLLAGAGPSTLVVVDWSAPWCGPCRAIKPFFEQCAQQHAGAVFVGVDIEASEPNKMLAQEAGVRALPTFHFYRNSVRLEELKGAHQGNLTAAIVRHLAAASPTAPAPPAAAAGPSAPPIVDDGQPLPSTEQMVSRVGRALKQLKDSCSFDEFVTGTRTALKFVENVLAHPTEAKYRRVRLGNAMFHQRLGSRQGGLDCMRAFGFQPAIDGGETVLVMSERAAGNPALQQVQKLLEQAVPPTPPGGGAPSAAVPPAPAGGMPGAGAGPAGMPAGMPDMATMMQMMGGMGGAGGAGGGGVGMQDMMRQMLAQNPEMMRQMFNPEHIRQVLASPLAASIPAHARTMMQQIVDNPALAQQMQQMVDSPMIQQMMNNPQAMQQMLQNMPGGGLGGMGAAGAANPFAPGPTNPFAPGPAPPAGGTPSATPGAPQPGAPGGDAGVDPSSGMTEEEMLEEAIRRSLDPGSQ